VAPGPPGQGRLSPTAAVQADSDDALMARVGAGEAEAFAVLVERHLDAIHRYVQRLTGSAADADELAQETFLRVWTEARRYQPATVRFSTWLHRIAHNLSVDTLRRRRSEPLEDPDALSDCSAGPEQAHAARQTAVRLAAALSALPQNQRAALLLTEVQGLSNQQVAEVMALGVRAVESLLARARRTLREQLQNS